MNIRKEHESYILDAHNNCQRPKDKRHNAINIRFRQGDGMIAVKSFLDGVEGACPDIAVYYTQGAESQQESPVLEPAFRGCWVVSGFGVTIARVGLQSDENIRNPKMEKEPPGTPVGFSRRRLKSGLQGPGRWGCLPLGCDAPHKFGSPAS